MPEFRIEYSVTSTVRKRHYCTTYIDAPCERQARDILMENYSLSDDEIDQEELETLDIDNPIVNDIHTSGVQSAPIEGYRDTRTPRSTPNDSPNPPQITESDVAVRF